MRLLVTRPDDDARDLIAALRARGHEVLHAPMMTIAHLTDETIGFDGVQGFLATSANGVRALVRCEAPRDLPLYAVGNATARTARAAGFVYVTSASGDVEDLVRLVARSCEPRAGALLHAAGSETAGDLAGGLGRFGFVVRRAVLYRAEETAGLAPEIARALSAGEVDGVLLFSPRTAKIFTGLLVREDVSAPSNLTAFCLSDSVAAAARRGGLLHCAVALKPDLESLIALIPHGPAA